MVDASQGVEAQTLANVYQAIENNHEIITVLNKIDLMVFISKSAEYAQCNECKESSCVNNRINGQEWIMLKQVFWVVIIMLSQAVMAQAQSTNEPSSSLDQTVFELERSNAILQLSKASSEELNALRYEMVAVSDQVDVLSNLMFLLVVAFCVLGWRSHKQNQRLEQLERQRTEGLNVKE